jgi:hypothetical protein
MARQIGNHESRIRQLRLSENKRETYEFVYFIQFVLHIHLDDAVYSIPIRNRNILILSWIHHSSRKLKVT